MCLGLFDKSTKQNWIQKAKGDGLKHSESQTILDSLSGKLLKLFCKKIWLPRCERTIAWERTQNINIRSKRKKEIVRETGIRSRHSNPSSPGKHEVPNRLISEAKYARNLRNEEERNLGNKVQEIVWDWIKEGKKWLGV